MWGFKKKNKVEEKKYSQNITVQGEKFYHLFNIRPIKKHDNLETFVANVYITDRIDDVMLIDYPSPIAFEIPEDKPELIESIILSYDRTKSGRELSDKTYTYIGNIKTAEDGRLYYYNEPPSREVAAAIDVEEQVFQREYIERQKEIQEARARNEKARQEEEFRRRLQTDEIIEENRRYEQQKRNDRLKNPYFKRMDGFGNEGYDIINDKTGDIILLRNMKKFKDLNGRYLYTAFMRSSNEDAYTEYNIPLGHEIIFTTPGRLADIIENQNLNQTMVKALQNALSVSCIQLDRNPPREMIDIGGITSDGNWVENTERNGISKALVEKIKSLGAKGINELEQDI